MFNYKELEDDNWIHFSEPIYVALKKELQSGGLIKKIKTNIDPELSNKINTLIKSIKIKNNIFELDDQINDFASDLLKINNEITSLIYYDYLKLLELRSNQETYPATSSAIIFIKENKDYALQISRLSAIISRIINESLNQANKSNAGTAIQNIVKATLMASGLQSGLNYREDYKSNKSVEANFVFPAIPDYCDNEVEAILACQMSSNDRIKLASEELKVGKLKFIFTGNGLDASSKRLRNISDPIIKDLYSKNIKLICYNKEIKFEINRIKNNKKNIDKQSNRLLFIKENVYSISKFANLMHKNFS